MPDASTAAATRQSEPASGTLSLRALNRATLERQMLLRRSPRSLSGRERSAAAHVMAAVEHLTGMQAQAPFPPYFGLWSRLEDFDPHELGRLILERRVVRIALMRGTVHLVTADDALMLRPLTQPVLDRGLRTSRGAALAGVDLEQLAAIGRTLLEEKPRTNKELGPLLARWWPDHDPSVLCAALRTVLPLVQVPPRGVWGAAGQATHTTVEHWLGRPLQAQPSLETMVLRYLAAYGPATVSDIQTWSGLTRLRPVVERLARGDGPGAVRVFRDEQGRAVYDLPDAPRPDPDTPAPPRLLPEFDNVLLSYDERTRILPEQYRKVVFGAKNGLMPATFLLDGFVAGTWKLTRERHTATVVFHPFQRISRQDRDGLEQEATGLLEFAAADATTRQIRFEAP